MDKTKLLWILVIVAAILFGSIFVAPMVWSAATVAGLFQADSVQTTGNITAGGEFLGNINYSYVQNAPADINTFNTTAEMRVASNYSGWNEDRFRVIDGVNTTAEMRTASNYSGWNEDRYNVIASVAGNSTWNESRADALYYKDNTQVLALNSTVNACIVYNGSHIVMSNNLTGVSC